MRWIKAVVITLLVIVCGMAPGKVEAQQACCQSSECSNCPPSDNTCTETCSGVSASCGAAPSFNQDGTCARTYTSPFEWCTTGWQNWSACIGGFTTRVCVSPAQLQVVKCGTQSCFVPGTIVSSPGGDKKIEDIKVGDEVSSFANDKIVNSSVSQIYKAQRDFYFDLKAGSYEVKVTAEHPFYIGSGKFEQVQNLKVGDRVYVEENGGLVAKQVTSNTRIDEKTDVYNMSVDNTNTYGSSVKQSVSNRD